MKKLPSLLARALPLAVLIALPVTGQVALAEKPIAPASNTAPAKFELIKTRVTPSELAFVRERYALAQQRQATGVGSPEDLSNWAYQIKDLERRATYLLAIRSAGGPLSAFVAAMSGSEDVSFELINAGEPSDLETPLPPFNLRNANWGTVIGVLDSFLASRGLQLKFVGGDRPNPAEAKSVVCVLRRTDSPAEMKRSSQAEFDSFQLGDHIYGTQTVEIIVDAIRTAWELDASRDAKALVLKFHPGTQILLVSGPAPAGAIARQVIAGLRKNPIQR